MKCRMMTVGKPVWRVGLSILPGSAAHRESVTKVWAAEDGIRERSRPR